jgi:hypothetical protein
MLAGMKSENAAHLPSDSSHGRADNWRRTLRITRRPFGILLAALLLPGGLLLLAWVLYRRFVRGNAVASTPGRKWPLLP